MNLEMMLEYGCDAWKSNLEVFTAMQAKAQDRLQELKKEIQDVNWERKDKQLKAGDKLKQLEAQWVMLVSKNYEIEQACAKLEEEIYKKRPNHPNLTESNPEETVGEEASGEAELPEEEEEAPMEEQEQEEVNQENEEIE